MDGQFFWYDLMTSNMDGARRFYAAVLGWAAQDSGVPGADYTVFTVGGVGALGLMPVPKEMAGAPPFWLGYVHVEDVDAAAARIEKLGGKMMRPPRDVPGVIRFCPVTDPQGGGFMIAKPVPPQGPKALPNVVGWRELYAVDAAAAFDFYAKAFGWTKGDAMDMGPMGTYQLFKTGGAEAVGGMMNKQPAMPRPYWGFYFTVDAIDAAAKRVTENGGRILHGPMQVPGGDWIVQCADPQGALFSLTGKHT